MEGLVTVSTGHAPLRLLLERSYSGRRVLITGHNGFVGSWLCHWLTRAGADVTGVSLAPPDGGIAQTLGLDAEITSIVGDLRDPRVAQQVTKDLEPEIVFHLAAQALVLPSYDDPAGTLATNILGTAYVLDAIRQQACVRACVIVTSDKCYATATGAHVEEDPLGGDDPYSASKGAAEIITNAYRHSFFSGGATGLATARAGNIIGGGDWAEHRLVPDFARSVLAGTAVGLRHPGAVRPWQHVLDAVAGYLRLADRLLGDPVGYGEAWNFGPSPEAATTVGEVVTLLVKHWRALGEDVADPIVSNVNATPERAFLTLVSAKAHERLGWSQLLELDSAIEWTVGWYHAAATGPDGAAVTTTNDQIDRYVELDEQLMEFTSNRVPSARGPVAR